MLEELKIWLATNGVPLLAVVLKAVIITVVGLFIIRAVNKLLDKFLRKSKLEKAAHSLLKGLVKTVLCILLALIVASSLGVDVTGIVALASVLTLAVSLALQNMLANVIGGFTLLYTHPFTSGDFVEIAGQSGAVQEVGIAYTKLMTPDNKLISIPNSAVVAAQIVNYTATGCRRVDIDISASYETPTQLVIDTLVGTANASFVLTEPEKPYAVLVGYGESTINYTLRFWVKTDDYWAALFAVNQKIKEDFDAAGVKMSFPHLNVHIDK
jgi:small conductance mechanosensitive channel